MYYEWNELVENLLPLFMWILVAGGIHRTYIKDWPEVKSSNTLSATAEELFKDTRSYSVAYTEITDNQLAYLQAEIIRDEAEGILVINKYNSWLHYEKSRIFR